MTTSFESKAELDRNVQQLDFVRTGPGTAAGLYLRRFWQPIHLSAKLTIGLIVPIRILGQSESVNNVGRKIKNRLKKKMTKRLLL